MTKTRYLTVDDLADRLQITKGTVYFWNHKGTGPKYIRIGRHARYSEAEVAKWEAARAA